MNYRRWFTAGACLALALFAMPALAAVHTIKLGAPYSAASFMTPTTAEQHLGAGSWSKLNTSPKAELYVDVASTFGASFTIDQIASVQYHTKSDVVNPSGIDFFMAIYTQPYVGGFASWYGQRLNAEPYLTNGYVPQTPGSWSAWKTAAGANQLTFNDSNHSGNQGFYFAPTLADVQAGAIDWASLGSNPTAGSATGGAIDYGAQPVKFLSFQTGSGWSSFRGWIDDVTVTLTTGDTYILDFESTTDPLYVDNAWTGSGLGLEVSPGRWFGYNAFANLGDAVAAAQTGGTINVAAGTYVVGATINSSLANLTIQGAGSGSTKLQVSSAVGNALVITGSGSTVRDLAFEKTDLPGAPHNMLWVNATNVTVRDNLFYGPDPGTPWSVNGIVSRGIVVSPGSNGLVIQGNTFHHLRQPAYIDALTGGSVVNNHVSGTRGWVVAGATLTFTGNTWGPPENQGAEIALLSTCNPADYPNLLALSSANSNAYISGQFPGASSGRAIGYVNASAAPGGFGSSSAPYLAVQDGVDNTLPGGTVAVAAGSYTGQVVVNGKNLTIQGAGSASTTIVSPVTLAASFTTPTNNAPVMFLENAPDIRVLDLTVDGAGRGNSNYRFIGIGFWNAGGKVLNCNVAHVRETPVNGNQHGNGIYAFNNTAGPYAIEVGNCNVSDFQKNGITMNGDGLTANVHDCVVTGNGNIAYTAQNGLQIAFGAGGSVSNTSVSGIFYTPNTASACALLAYQGSSLTVNQFTATACQVGAYYENMNGSLNGITVAGNTSGVMSTGVLVYDSNASLAARSAGKSGLSPQRPVSPVTEDGVSAKSSLAVSSAPMNVNVGPGCLTGDNLPGSWGVQVYGSGGPLTCSISGLELTDWDYGIVAGGVNATTTAYHNSIAGNVSGGYLTDPGLTNTASNNWWGNASGPSGTGPGTGDAISGPGVVFAPWLVTGDTNPACGFTFGPDNVVAAGPAPSCLSAANTCITIPVGITRTTSEGARGYSVTLQLSSNLVLCAGPSSITQGTYLSAVGGTNFQVVDNGGGSYTVDCAILGPTSGATAVNGNLFNVAVAKAPGPDGTGTITISSVTMRDVLNAPIAATAGTPLSISIDTGGPAAMANLTAAQKKIGNDGDGTTKILLTFTAPVDAAVVQVYRAPFGQYPEYDDAGGIAPVAPAYPPVAPWTLTAVTASGQFDEPATRDFWYYVAFSTDACGNVSAVSNRTNGTLNYHLGDVSNGFVAGAGNNLVNTADISLLGAHYGITLAPFSPFNYLDVGPTTDFSVNARPTTDNKVGFEDLMMFAINYSVVSAPQDRPVLASAGTNNIEVAASSKSSAGVGETFIVPVRMSGAGNVLGASIAFGYDASVVEFVSAEAGELLAAQGRSSVVLSPSAGVVDYALLGEGAGVEGEGVLMNVTFRRITAGDPAVSVRSVTARDAANQPVALAGSKPAVPATTMLGSAYPNPFRGRTSMQLSLARDGHARVSVYDLVGRRIRTLIDGQVAAGEQTLVWDGRDDDGRAVAAGLYMVRFDTPGAKQSRRLVLMP